MKVMLLLCCTMAMTTEMAMNTTMRPRMVSTCFFSSISLTTLSLRRSSVRVELEAMTRLESVDMEAESTRMTTMPIRSGERFSSIAGMMAS